MMKRPLFAALVGFVLAASAAAAVSFFVSRDLNEDNSEPIKQLHNLAVYALPPPGETPEEQVATSFVTVVGTDEPRNRIPAPDSPVPGEDGSSAASPLPTSSAGPSAGSSAPAGGEVFFDACAVDPTLPHCPQGVLATVRDSEDESGAVSLALTDLSFVEHRVLFAPGEGRQPGPGIPPECTSFPSPDEVVFLIGTTAPTVLSVAYWPTRFVPGGTFEPSAGARVANGIATFGLEGTQPRYLGCVSLDIGRSMAFELSIRATASDGAVAHSEILEFCLECPTLLPDLPLDGIRIQPHAWWAEAVLEDPPRDGSLEFAYRLPGGRWRSVIQSGVPAGSPVRLWSQPDLLPATTYEFQAMFRGGGVTLASDIGTFQTLPFELTVRIDEHNGLHVEDDGDDLSSGELTSVYFELCDRLVCHGETGAEVTRGELALVSSSPDFGPRSELPIDSGGTVLARPSPSEVTMRPSSEALSGLDPASYSWSWLGPRYFRLTISAYEDDHTSCEALPVPHCELDRRGYLHRGARGDSYRHYNLPAYAGADADPTADCGGSAPVYDMRHLGVRGSSFGPTRGGDQDDAAFLVPDFTRGSLRVCFDEIP